MLPEVAGTRICQSFGIGAVGAMRRTFGSIRTLCWTDHANYVRTPQTLVAGALDHGSDAPVVHNEPTAYADAYSRACGLASPWSGMAPSPRRKSRGPADGP